jgi:hypothetical protein
MAYDGMRHNVVLFGGEKSPPIPPDLLNDTWIWDGTDWIEQNPESSPSPRITQLVFDAALGEAVLLGGNAGLAGQYSDMWGWDGANWSSLAASLPPGFEPRTGATAAYDDATASIVALGCVGLSPMTFVFDGTAWRQASSGTLTTCAPSIAYDARRSVVVIFGGTTGRWTNATWTWDGAQWMLQAPPHSPPARVFAAAAFDVATSQLIIFGGEEPFGAQNAIDVATTWAWDGADWVQVGS